MNHCWVAMIVVVIGGASVSSAAGQYTFTIGVDELWRVDSTTGALETIGPLGGGVQISALAMSVEGQLYGVGTEPGEPHSLYTVDPETGAAARIGDTGLGAPPNPVDLAVDDGGMLWMQTARDLYVVDLATGAASLQCSQSDPDVEIAGLGIVDGTKYVYVQHPDSGQPLSCGLTRLPSWGDGIAGQLGPWFDTTSQQQLVGLQSWCDPWDCLDRNSRLVRVDPVTGDLTELADIEDLMFVGLALAPQEQPQPTTGIPMLGSWALLALCCTIAAAGSLALRHRLT